MKFLRQMKIFDEKERRKVPQAMYTIQRTNYCTVQKLIRITILQKCTKNYIQQSIIDQVSPFEVGSGSPLF